ncbi:Sporulation related domain-containing protein [Tistlia consotensis]|uniref:Sporulation related domain-containing protein n=1 Tax=Tistlia consotensis USBA 355 TaxID=560819 RepID=A0A1Y6BLW8_9PROT|nr:SPOR domain-containing protein [Tistlia consotensis]SMF14210.1 Sporulation related domain-containing protein [Tistlia consotensis USBA 355]SNR49694.1 Sporulation related domain-containing protein [Tistlia consotensis]
MPSDRIRQDEMTGDLGPDYLRGRHGAAGSDLGGAQNFGQPGFGGGEEPPRRSRLLPLVIAFFALAAFAGIVWYAYEWGVGDVEPEHLPVVQAPSGAIKEKPAEPGGLEVPYTDSAVLNRDGSEKPSKVESLLPPPEEPVAVPKAPEPKPAPAPEQKPAMTEPAQPEAGKAMTEAAPAGQHAEVPPAPGVGLTRPSELPELPKPATQAAKSEPAKPAETVAPEAKAPEAKAPEARAPEARAAAEPMPEKPVEAPKPVAEAPPAPPVAAKEVAPSPTEAPKAEAAKPAAAAAEVKPGSWVVQLAALRKESEAKAAWSEMQAKHKDLLGAMTLQLDRADLGDRGVFYRVQTGPLPNRATALDLCAQLKAAGQACIAKRR